MNGQIWQQAEYSYHYHYAFMPNVIIFSDSGGYKMQVEGVNKIIRVQQLTGSQVIESYIDGTFTGWTGDTIFKLRNGQIWQQTSYAYTYHYAYSPAVLIYSTSGGYKMTVTGVSTSIYVKRLK
jgi:uncharacterized protein YodC (DUF2158 family)